MVSRRDILKILTGTVLCSGINSLGLTMEEDLEKKVKSIKKEINNNTSSEELIEKEINKWDPWILDYIKDIKFVRAKFIAYNGGYNLEKEEIVIPYFKTVKETSNFKQNILDAIDHELTHAVFENKLIPSDDYSGPSMNDIKENILNILRSDKRKLLLKIYDVYLYKNRYSVKEYSRKFGSIENFIMKDFSDEKYEKYSEIFEKAEKKVEKNLKSNFNPKRKKEELFIEKIKNEGIKKIIKEDAVEIYMGYRMCDISPFLRDRAIRKYYIKEFPWLELETNNVDFKIIRNNHMEELYKHNVPTQDIRPLEEYFLDKHLHDTLIYETNARMINSLMSIYTGPNYINKWELNNKELGFLSKLKHKNQSVFKKAIEKYRIAKDMKINGEDWKAIQEKLEYTTSFKYKGKEYNWPENGFKFKKIIPDMYAAK